MMQYDTTAEAEAEVVSWSHDQYDQQYNCTLCVQYMFF